MSPSVLMATLLLTAASPAPAAAPVDLVGVVSEHGAGACPSGREAVWSDLHLRVGAVRVAPGSVDLRPWLGRLVRVTGQIADATPPSPPGPLGTTPCGLEQMRSDWYATPAGVRRWEGGATPFGALVVAGLAEAPGLAFSRERGRLRVTVGPLATAAKLALKLEYLGEAGKPGSVFVARALALRPGRVAEARFDVTVGPSGRSGAGFRAELLRVTGGAGGLFFDASLPAPEEPPPHARTVLPKALVRALRAALGDDARAQTAEARLEPGPLGVEVACVAIPGAYPGTGVARAVVFNGRAYGQHADQTLAELVRAAGWHTRRPGASDLLSVVNAAEFNGLLSFDAASVTLAGDARGLALRFVQTEPFNPSARTRVTVTLPVEGPMTLTSEPEAR